MKRREIKIIITEDMSPVSEELPPCGPNYSQVAYRISHGGKEYGSYVAIDSPTLSEDEVVKAASVLITMALEAFELLEGGNV